MEIATNNTQSVDHTWSSKNIVDKIYPVGAIFTSVNNVNPQTYLGGSWESIGGRFLFGAGSNSANTTDDYGSLSANQINRTAGELGGEINHTLTTNEMPSHRHNILAGYNNSGSGKDALGYTSQNQGSRGYQYILGNSNQQAISNTGGGNAHNNMPPYMVVYFWKRTA